jgi:hypothetical protein
MPGQRRTVLSHSRASWLPRLAGLGAIVVVAAAGTVIYVAAFHPGSSGPLPTRVVGYQTVGLIAEHAQSQPGSMIQLLGAGHTAQFSPVAQAEQLSGDPQWTADQMAGGSYIFIYLPNGECLASAASASGAQLAIQHCDLSTQQRWRTVGKGVQQDSHVYYQFANLASGKCITQTGGPTDPTAAGLATCDASQPPRQLIAFWWNSN